MEIIFSEIRKRKSEFFAEVLRKRNRNRKLGGIMFFKGSHKLWEGPIVGHLHLEDIGGHLEGLDPDQVDEELKEEETTDADQGRYIYIFKVDFFYVAR